MQLRETFRPCDEIEEMFKQRDMKHVQEEGHPRPTLKDTLLATACYLLYYLAGFAFEALEERSSLARPLPRTIVS